MISHDYHKTQTTWKKILLWDFVVPLAMVFIAAWFLDQRLAKPLLQYLVNLPFIGLRIYQSTFFPWYVYWHFWIFVFPPLLFCFGISFRTARIPGPGRAVLRWYQGLLQLKIRKESPVDLFPPVFSHKSKEVRKWHEALKSHPVTYRLLGRYRRFQSDIEQDRRNGKDTEVPGTHFPIVITDPVRFRHIQVVGGSGSGKSAALIAPMLIDDAGISRLATLTLNPKGDVYLLKVMADGPIRRRRFYPAASQPPTAVVSFSRKDSLAYDPLLYGDADALTKKIMGSSEIDHPYYRSFQETWLLAFFRVMLSEEALAERIMLRHLHHALIHPASITKTLVPLCKSRHNARRLTLLAAAKTESLSGLASHIGQFVDDDSLTHIFDNPTGRLLNVQEVLGKGGNIFIDVDTSSKGPQGRALGRMILMELQLLAGARQNGMADKSVGIQVFLDEFASFAYGGFINLLDKCRSARIGILLAHQSLGNLKRDYLPASFKDEVVDNTHTKFFLAVKDETAKWASDVLGSRKVIKKSLSIGHATEKTATGARETRTESYREETEPYVEPSEFNLALGHGFCMVENDQGKLSVGPMSVGYVEERDLCTDQDLAAFLKVAVQDHPFRPRGGSLIDNALPIGALTRKLSEAPAFSEGEISPKDPNLDPSLLLPPKEKEPGPDAKAGSTRKPRTSEARDFIDGEEP